MLAYQIKLALLSLKRNPVLSALLVGAIALGIAVATAFVTIYTISAGDPIPEKSHQLFYVEIDNWDPSEPFDDDHPERPPTQLAYRDVIGIMGSGIPKAETGMYKTGLNLFPEDGLGTPTNEEVRLCFADFFSMFQVPFRYGGPWNESADDGSSAAIVINDELNRRLFGGANSVGRSLKLEDRYFTVVGVLAPWRPTIKYYDPHNGAYQQPENIFMPFGFGRILEAASEGNSWGWTSWDGTTFEDFLQTEDLWLQMWVELETEAQRTEYGAFLDAYVLEQQRAGRLLRPVNNRLLTVMEWLEQKDVVPEQTRVLLLISLLFLVVCSVNLIGIFLGKFLARAPEVGVRRALGASRASVFFQHVVECELVGLLGGAIGIGASIGVLAAMDRLLHMQGLFRLNPAMVAAAVGLSLVAGLVAGVYPSWRICRTAPATHLKLQ